MEIEDYLLAELRSLGLSEPFDLHAPIIKGLGLDDEDWAMDFLPAIERRFGIKLDDLLLTDDYAQPNWVQRVIFRWQPWQLSRDVSIAELVTFVSDRTNGKEVP